jgi:hypothetical protein
MMRQMQITICTATVLYSQSRSSCNKHRPCHGLTVLVDRKGRQHTRLKLSRKKLGSRRSLSSFLIRRLCRLSTSVPELCSVLTICDAENAGVVSTRVVVARALDVDWCSLQGAIP